MSKHALLFSERQNIVRFIVNHVDSFIHFLGAHLITGDEMFRFSQQIAKKMQLIVRMCDFELKFNFMLLIFNLVKKGNISRVKNVDIVIQMLLFFLFLFVSLFVFFCSLLAFDFPIVFF